MELDPGVGRSSEGLLVESFRTVGWFETEGSVPSLASRLACVCRRNTRSEASKSSPKPITTSKTLGRIRLYQPIAQASGLTMPGKKGSKTGIHPALDPFIAQQSSHARATSNPARQRYALYGISFELLTETLPWRIPIFPLSCPSPETVDCVSVASS